MFQVERNARENAAKLYEELQAKGVSKAVAGRLAAKQEAKEVRDGNKWIKDNVGLN